MSEHHESEPVGGPQPPATGPAGQPSWRSPVGEPPQTAQPAPAGPRRQTSLLDGLPPSDFVRDGVAVLLLFVSLALPWTSTEKASGRVEVILITVLSALTLTVPYLARAGVFGPTWNVLRTRLVRLLGNLPYLLLVLVYLVLDLVDRGSGDGDLSRLTGGLGTVGGLGEVEGLSGWSGMGSAGLGTAAALGLAGALLAAQPRRAELGPPRLDHRVGPGWTTGLRIGALVTAVATLLSLVLWLLDLSDVGGVATSTVLLSVAAVAAVLGVGAWPAFATSRGGASWRLALIGVATAVTVVFVLGAGESSSLPRVESLSWAGFGLVLVPGLAAVAASPALARSLPAVSPQQLWTELAAAALVLAAVAAGCRALMAVGYLVSDLDADTTQIVLLLVFTLLSAAAALAGRALLTAHGPGARTPALALTTVVLVLGTVMVVVAASADYVAVSWLDLLLAFGFPAIAGIALLAPPSMRPAGPRVRQAPVGWEQQPQQRFPAQQFPTERFPTEQFPTGQFPTGQFPTGQFPAAERGPVGSHERPVPDEAPVPSAQAVPPPPVPQAHGWTPSVAADPATDGEALSRIVTEAPELRPYVAANPSTYPALLEWLANLQDPRVDAALQARPR